MDPNLNPIPPDIVDAPPAPTIPPKPTDPPIRPSRPNPDEKPNPVYGNSRNIFKRRKKKKSKPDAEIAHERTSEYVVRAMASIAVRLAIRTDSLEKQREGVRAEEQSYLTRLWNRYTKRALRLSPGA